MTTNNLVDGDYLLTEGSAWFDVKGFAIRIHSTDEGVVVDVFNAAELRDDPFCDTIASTYAYASECALSESDDTTDDGEALASAGRGTNEDYGSASEVL